MLDTAGTPSVIDTTDRIYGLRLRSGDRIDAEDFEVAARAGLAAISGRRTRLLQGADALWAGEPLPEERYADWALAWRERLTTCTPPSAPPWPTTACDAVTSWRCAASGRRGPLRPARRGRAPPADGRLHALSVEPATETARLHQRILAGQSLWR